MRTSLVAATAVLFLADPVHADVLVDNVDGLTLTADGRVERFAGVLVGDDGRIQQVFQRSDKRPVRVDYRLDGKGRVMMPGLIDAHLHLMNFGIAALAPQAGGKLPPPRPEDRDLALLAAQRLLLERGVTAVTDMGTTIEDWQTYRRAGDLGTLTIRIMAYADGIAAMRLIGGPGPSPWLYDDRLRLNGVKLVLDGTLAARAAALKAPYADAPSQSGVPKLNPIQLKNLMSGASLDHFQVAVTASGDQANATLIDAIGELGETYRGDRRWRIEHAVLLGGADVARLGKLGVVASMQPQRLAADRLVAEARLGPARLAGIHGWKSLAAAGAKLAFGSGAPAEPPDPFAGMAAAITRQGADSLPFGGWQPQERLTREAALAGWTTGAAWAGFADGRLGRIAVGQRADFLLVDRDPLLASPAELRAMKVLQTWVGGRLVWQAKDGIAPRTP